MKQEGACQYGSVEPGTVWRTMPGTVWQRSRDAKQAAVGAFV